MAAKKIQDYHVHSFYSDGESTIPSIIRACANFNLPEKIISDSRICVNGSLNFLQAGGNDAKIKPRLSKSSSFEVKKLVELIRRRISV